jgi:hypothetical protein
MSRKKHAWNALWYIFENKEDFKNNENAFHNAERGVEAAVIEDFMDDIDEELARLFNLLDQAPNNDIKFGIMIAQDIIRNRLDTWYNL